MLTSGSEIIKDPLCNASVVALSKFSQPFKVECDASDIEQIFDQGNMMAMKD